MSERLIVVGITGEAGAGKDTIASTLSHRYDFFRIALADGVRAAFRDMDGMTEGLTKELEKAGLTKRWGLQRVGSDAREKVATAAVESYGDRDKAASDEHLINCSWVYLLAFKIAYLSSIHPVTRFRFVVPDISFDHEPEMLSSIIGQLGGHYETWRVERPGAGLNGVEGQHASEEGRRRIRGDATIKNDGSKFDLESWVMAVANVRLGL